MNEDEDVQRELRVLQLEMRAGFAEMRADMAQIRSTLQVIVDSVADLRNEYRGHTHE